MIIIMKTTMTMTVMITMRNGRDYGHGTEGIDRKKKRINDAKARMTKMHRGKKETERWRERNEER